METLLELAALLNKKRLSKIDLLDKTFVNNNNDLYYQFYVGLVNGKFTNDLIACKSLYGLERPDHRFRMLKSRMKKKLTKTILLIDQNDYFTNNEKNKNYCDCITTLNIIEILIKINGVSKTVESLITDNYKKAEEFKFYEILKTYSFYLLSYYSLSGNIQKYQQELLKFNKYREAANYEISVKQLNSLIHLLLTHPFPINNNFIQNIKKHLSDFEIIISAFPDPESMFYYYYSLNQFNEISADYDLILKVCDKIEKVFLDNPYVSTTGRRTIVLLYRLKVLLHLKKYTEGLKLIQNSNDIIDNTGYYNQSIVKEYSFRLNLNTNNIDACKKLHQEITTYKFFKRNYEHVQERWKIYEAFMVFMDSYLNKGDFKFPVAKFINSVPFYTKDKSGFNLTIRLIEILYLFGKKQYDIIFCKMDALKVYKTRYLNDDTYIRSRLFLNALFKAEKDGFNAKAMRKGYPEIEQLNNKEKQLIIADWEVIPYENLWEILTDLAKE